MAEHVYRRTPMVDSETGRTFAVGVCVSCGLTRMIVCSMCKEPLFVNALTYTCVDCDCLGDACLPMVGNINGRT